MSCAVSGVLYALFRSIPLSLWAFVGGTLIDLDHLYDYHRYPHRPAHRRFDPRHFFDVMYQSRLERVFLLLHAWELAASLLVVGRLVPAWSGWMIPLGFGMSVHLMLDAFLNNASIAGYSLIARGAHCFDGGFFYGRRTGKTREPAKQSNGAPDPPDTTLSR